MNKTSKMPFLFLLVSFAFEIVSMDLKTDILCLIPKEIRQDHIMPRLGFEDLFSYGLVNKQLQDEAKTEIELVRITQKTIVECLNESYVTGRTHKANKLCFVGCGKKDSLYCSMMRVITSMHLNYLDKKVVNNALATFKGQCNNYMILASPHSECEQIHLDRFTNAELYQQSINRNTIRPKEFPIYTIFVIEQNCSGIKNELKPFIQTSVPLIVVMSKALKDSECAKEINKKIAKRFIESPSIPDLQHRAINVQAFFDGRWKDTQGELVQVNMKLEQFKNEWKETAQARLKKDKEEWEKKEQLKRNILRNQESTIKPPHNSCSENQCAFPEE